MRSEVLDSFDALTATHEAIFSNITPNTGSSLLEPSQISSISSTIEKDKANYMSNNDTNDLYNLFCNYKPV